MKDNLKLELSISQKFIKRAFDIFFSGLGLIFTSPIILLAALVSCVDARGNGFITQTRIGLSGQNFRIIKIRTMRYSKSVDTFVTIAGDSRITTTGAFFRRSKIDELPQLINVFLGQMSFVGPRPDVLGFADKLEGRAKNILNVRPGITGPATLKYRNEEEMLQQESDPERYNAQVIFPDKVKINLQYIREYTFVKDLKYIWKTVAG